MDSIINTKDNCLISNEFLTDLLNYVIENLNNNEWRRDTSERNNLYIDTIEEDIKKIERILIGDNRRCGGNFTERNSVVINGIEFDENGGVLCRNSEGQITSWGIGHNQFNPCQVVFRRSEFFNQFKEFNRTLQEEVEKYEKKRDRENKLEREKYYRKEEK